jgi:hypothetical protein
VNDNTEIDTYGVNFEMQCIDVIRCLRATLNDVTGVPLPSNDAIKSIYYSMRLTQYIKLRKYFDINEIFIYDRKTGEEIKGKGVTYGSWHCDIAGIVLMIARFNKQYIQTIADIDMKNAALLKLKTIMKAIVSRSIKKVKDQKAKGFEVKTVLNEVSSIPKFEVISEADIERLLKPRPKRDDQKPRLRNGDDGERFSKKKWNGGELPSQPLKESDTITIWCELCAKLEEYIMDNTNYEVDIERSYGGPILHYKEIHPDVIQLDLTEVFIKCKSSQDIDVIVKELFIEAERKLEERILIQFRKKKSTV